MPKPINYNKSIDIDIFSALFYIIEILWALFKGNFFFHILITFFKYIKIVLENDTSLLTLLMSKVVVFMSV